MSRWFETFVLVGVVAGLGACAERETALPLVGTLERDRIEIVAQASERIVELDVVEGDRVAAGRRLAQLDARLQHARVRQAEAAREAAAQRLAELVRGPREESIRESRALLDGAREDVALQAREVTRATDLVERKLAPQADLDIVRNRLASARAHEQALRAQLDALVAGTTAEEIAQAQAQLALADAELESERLLAAKLEVTAPRPGQIEALPYKLGEQPPLGATMIVMLADDAPYARVYVPEPLRARVEPGMRAIVAIDGIDRTYAGEVRFVAADAAFTPYFALTERDRSRLTFVTEVRLTEPEARELPTGVMVEVDLPELRSPR
jgi:HlyD family secretion protein